MVMFLRGYKNTGVVSSASVIFNYNQCTVNINPTPDISSCLFYESNLLNQSNRMELKMNE